MTVDIKSESVKIIQDMNQAVMVIHAAGKWLLESGKNPSKWWQPKNLNAEFLLQYAKEDEFYVALVDNKPAAAAIFQLSQNAQDWESVDKGQPKKTLYIHWLCVNRHFAGKDLPKIIVDFAAKKAKEAKVKLLRADSNAEEIKLGKIYEGLGFSLIALIEEDYRKTALYQKRVS